MHKQNKQHIPVQEGCYTVLEVGKSHKQNTSGTRGLCQEVPTPYNSSLSLLCSITIHCDFYSDLYHISDRCTGTFRSPAQVPNFFSTTYIWLIISKTVSFTENVYWTLNVSIILLYNTCSKHFVTPSLSELCKKYMHVLM